MRLIGLLPLITIIGLATGVPTQMVTAPLTTVRVRGHSRRLINHPNCG
jgi:hypothetical protein